MNNTQKFKSSSESGNAVVIVLVVLVVIAVGALAYLATQMNDGESQTQDPAAQMVAADQETAATDENAAPEQTAEATDAENQEAVQVPAPQEPVEVKPGNPTVAVVNGEEIKRMDVLNFIQTLPEQTRQRPIDQLFPQALEQVVNAKLVEEKAEAVNLDNNPEVQEQLEQAKRQIVSTVYLQQEVEKEVTEERLREGYNLYVENFPEIQEVKAKHILVDDEAKAQELIEQLNEGASFEELAQENSKDNTAEQGGDLGYFAQTDVVPEFADAAFALEPGSVTQEPVQTQFGYHVIKVEDKRQRPPAEFEQAKPFLETQIRAAVLNGILQGWREEADIKKFDINGEPIEESATAETAPAAETPAEENAAAE